MADKGGGFAKCLNPKYPQTGRIATKLPKSPLHVLQYRELGGIHRHHRRAVNTQTFHKLPGRLGFSLRNLVDESILHEGHVFLGFNKSGQFVLSYTLQLEADEHTSYPVYVYRLQWWHFMPYKRLRKVSEVRLFGEEDIQQDLYIAVCEWPTDETRILIYGYCAPCDNEEKHQCYITITAVPPVEPCDDCSQLAILHARSSSNHLYDAVPRCLNHAFTVHTKYELSPPYPPFAPKIYLKLDGVLVVNTGDSLIALSVNIEDNHGGFGFGLYSPRVTRSVSNLSTASSSPSDCDQMSCDCDLIERPTPLLVGVTPLEELLENTSQESVLYNTGGSGGATTSSVNNIGVGSTSGVLATQSPQGSVPALPGVMVGAGAPTTTNIPNVPKQPCDGVNGNLTTFTNNPGDPAQTQPQQPAPMRVFTVRERASTNNPPPPGKENQLGVSSPPGTTPHHEAILPPPGRYETPNAKLHKAWDVYNFEGSTPKKDEVDTSEYYEVVHESPSSSQPGGSKVRAPLVFSGYQQSASMGATTEEINLYQGDSMDSQSLEDDLDKPSVFQKPTAGLSTLRTAQRGDLTGGAGGISPRGLSGLTLIPPDNFTLTKGLCVSPGCGKLEQAAGSSTCSSCVSSPIILQSDSQCFTYSVRRFVECYGRPESPVDMEDDLNLAYHSVLPTEVHGANYCNMRLLTKQCFTPQTPCVVVKQLTLDIEHYLGEAVRTTAEWGHRYLAFTNYDVQIVELCPDSSEVIAFVSVLIRARPNNPKNEKRTHPHARSIPKLYESGFKLIWNLQTGSYTTLDVEDLREVNQRKQWQPQRDIGPGLQRRFGIPQLFSRSVHVLTNEAVFKGQSLKMLLDRHHYVAILL